GHRRRRDDRHQLPEFRSLDEQPRSRHRMTESVVIAIDGTAACGKGTLAKLLAKHFGFAHLDSGALYRLVALSVLEANGDPANEADALRAAGAIDITRAGDPKIRSDVVGKAASQVAAIPAVRQALH